MVIHSSIICRFFVKTLKMHFKMTDEKVLRLAKDRILYLVSVDEKYLEEFTMINDLPIERIFCLANEELEFKLKYNRDKHLESVVDCILDEIDELKELAINKGLQL